MQLLGSQTITGQLLLTDTGISASTATLVIQGASGQTASQQEWRNSGGSPLLAVLNTGALTSYGVAPTFGGLGTPVITAVTPTGGTGTTTYGYRVAAYNAAATTISSTEVTTTTGVAALSVSQYNLVQWNPIAGATGYRVYGRTAGAELLIATVAYGTNSFIDDGTLTPAGALPTAPAGSTFQITQWNSQTGPIFRVSQYGLTQNFFSISGSSGNTVMTAGATLAGTAGGGVLQSALLLSSTNAAAKGIAMVGASGQSGDMLSIMDVNNDVVARIGANGAIQNYGTYAVIGGLLYPAGVTVTPVGVAGTTTYGYRIAALTAAGTGTTASATVSTALGNATLDTNNYNTVSWNPVIGASSYRVYGRTAGGELLMVTVQSDGRSGQYSYNDQGTVTPAGALPTATGSTFLRVQSWVGQTTYMQHWLDYASNELASVQSNPATGVGVIQAWTASVGAGGLRLGSQPGFPNTPVIDSRGYHNSTDGSGAALRVFNYNLSTTVPQAFLGGNTGLLVTPVNASNVAAVLRGQASQVGDLTQWQDSTGAVLARMGAQGLLTTPGLQVNGSLWATGSVMPQTLVTSPNTLATPVISSITTAGTAGGTTYAYRVQAVNALGLSAPSAEVTITTGNAVISGTNYNVISWSAVAGATAYRVYGRSAGGEVLLASTASTSYNDNTANGGSLLVAAGGYNLLVNSSLNTNVSSWAQQNVTLARDLTVAPPFGGVTPGLITSTASGSVSAQTATASTNGYRLLAPVAASTTYTASAYVMLGTASAAYVGFQWFDSAGAYIGGNQGPTSAVAGSWSRLSYTATVPSTAAFVNVYIGVTTSAIGQTAWLAAPQIDLGSTVQPYVLDVPLATGGVYEGSTRVYSPNNPPPSTGSTTSTSLQITSSTLAPVTLGTNLAQFAGYATAGYYRRADGFVDLQGTLIASATIGAGATVVSGLPAPADGQSHVFNVILSGSTASIIAMTLSPTGVLTVAAGSIPATTVTIELDGISYYTGGSTSTYVAGPALAIPTDVPHAITPSTGWTALGGSWAAPKYITTASGMVYLQGIVVASASYGVGSGILSGLPVPADGLAHIFTAFDTVSGAASIVQLRQDGVLLNQAAISSGHTLCLDGIVYLTTTAGNAGFASSSFATSVKFGSER